MSNFNEIVDNYIASWNEADAAKRAALVAQTWTESALYMDPHMKGEGHTGIDGLIGAVQERFPDFKFRLVSDVEGHNDRLRFTWALGPENGDTIARGTDYCLIAQDGRMQETTGFLDYVAVPATA